MILERFASLSGPSEQAVWVCSLLSPSQIFVRLYRKDSEDQPRDGNGRWTDVGAVEVEVGSRNVETTGNTIVLQRYRSGNPDGATGRPSGPPTIASELFGHHADLHKN